MTELGKLDLIESGQALYKINDPELKVYMIINGSFKLLNAYQQHNSITETTWNPPQLHQSHYQQLQNQNSDLNHIREGTGGKFRGRKDQKLQMQEGR